MNGTLITYTTELRRIAHRRITRVAGVVGVAIVALLAGVTFFTHDAAPPDVAAAEALAEQNRVDCMTYNDWGDATSAEIESNCFQDPAWYLTDDSFHLQSLLLPYSDGSQSWSAARSAIGRSPLDNGSLELVGGVTPPDTNPAQGFGGVLGGFGVAALLGAAILASSFVGADWRSKAIETQLTFQPNRRRLLAGKVLAASSAGSMFATVMSSLLVAATMPSAVWRGDMAGTGTAFWTDVALTVGRIALASAVVATFAATVTMLFRNTVAGIVTVFGLGAIGLMVGVLSDGPLSGLDLFRNISAWISAGDVARSVTLIGTDGGYYGFQVLVHGWGMAGLVLVGYAAIATAFGATSFVRRDIS